MAERCGIGNVLRHDYEHVAHHVLWHVVHNDLLPLENVFCQELAAEQDRFDQT